MSDPEPIPYPIRIGEWCYRLGRSLRDDPAAIRATARPENTEALYFVASPKDDGTHVFSATLEEQNAAVARYVAHLRQRAAEPGR